MHSGVEEDVRLFESVRNDLSNRLSDLRGISDEELYEIIDELISCKEKEYRLSLRPKLKLRNSLFDSFRRLDILQELLDDKDITEIMVNGREDIFIEKKGRSIKWNKRFKSNEQLEDMIQQIVSEVNRVVNASSPIADARLKDGSRVHIVLPPVSLIGPIITIRKFPEVISMERLIAFEAISKEAADFLKKLVRAGYNIFISGGTNSGKTTFLNALSVYIPDDERVITIEDSAELQLKHIKNIVRLEAKPTNMQGEKAISIAELIKASLRMNPSRIVVGEVRGAEALDMLQAMNTGHDGSLSTGHGNSPKDMLSRLETMVLSAADLPLAAIRKQISSAIDIIVHLGRLRDKSRKVLSIVELGDCVNGEIKLNPLYEFREQKESRTDKVTGELKKLSELENKTKLKFAGERL